MLSNRIKFFKSIFVLLFIIGFSSSVNAAETTVEGEVKSDNGIYLSAGVSKSMLGDVSLYNGNGNDTTNTFNLAVGYQFVNFLKPSFLDKTALDIEISASIGDDINTNIFSSNSTPLIGSTIDDYELSYYSLLVRYNAYFTEKFFVGANLGITNASLKISAEEYNRNFYDYDPDYNELVNTQTVVYGVRVGYDINLHNSLSLDYTIYGPLEYTITEPVIEGILNTDKVKIGQNSAVSINYRYTFR